MYIYIYVSIFAYDLTKQQSHVVRGPFFMSVFQLWPGGNPWRSPWSLALASLHACKKTNVSASVEKKGGPQFLMNSWRPCFEGWSLRVIYVFLFASIPEHERDCYLKVPRFESRSQTTNLPLVDPTCCKSRLLKNVWLFFGVRDTVFFIRPGWISSSPDIVVGDSMNQLREWLQMCFRNEHDIPP